MISPGLMNFSRLHYITFQVWFWGNEQIDANLKLHPGDVLNATAKQVDGTDKMSSAREV